MGYPTRPRWGQETRLVISFEQNALNPGGAGAGPRERFIQENVIFHHVRDGRNPGRGVRGAGEAPCVRDASFTKGLTKTDRLDTTSLRHYLQS